MRSLVIGGNGFLGSHLVEALHAAGDRVRVLDVGSPREDVDWSGIDYHRGAFANDDDLCAALEDVDRIYHLASTTVPGTSNADPLADVEGNLMGTIRLLERMRSKGIRRLVYFSSGGTVYGNPLALPIDESHPTHPISSYGIVKLAIEKYLEMYQLLHGFSPLILRPANPYGPRQGTGGIQGVIPAFLERHRRGESIRVWGGDETIRDYIYVSDLVTLAVRAGNSESTGIFNVGSGVGHSLKEIMGAMNAMLATPLQIERLPARKFDVREVVLDIAKAQSTFCWRPLVSLEEGLAATWHWVSSQPRG